MHQVVAVPLGLALGKDLIFPEFLDEQPTLSHRSFVNLQFLMEYVSESAAISSRLQNSTTGQRLVENFVLNVSIIWSAQLTPTFVQL